MSLRSRATPASDVEATGPSDESVRTATNLRERLNERRHYGRGEEDPDVEEHFQFELDTSVTPGATGMCLSGGGIRSAAFGLGAMQRVKEAGLWDHVNYLAAVSGGGYIAAAEAITRSYTDDALLTERDSWSRGSPEAVRLRRLSDYLAPGPMGRVWLFLNMVWGIMSNLLPILAASMVVGGLYASLTFYFQPGLEGDAVGSVTFYVIPLVLGGLLFGCALAFVGKWRREMSGRKRRNFADLTDGRQKDAWWIAAVATVLVLLPVALPIVVWVSRRLVVWCSGLFGGASKEATIATKDVRVNTSDVGGTINEGLGTPEAIWAVLVVLALLATIGTLSVALARRSLAHRTMLTLAGLSGPMLVAVPGLALAQSIYSAGAVTGGHIAWMTVSLGICVVLATVSHSGRYSMHLFYKDRLANVFAVERTAKDQASVVGEAIRFSKIRGDGGPELLMCAAVNVSDRLVPTGRRSSSFVFTRTECYSPIWPDEKFPMADVERPMRFSSALTLPSIVAISGAALSPAMGRLTIRPLSFLLAIFNLRLGVWIPNPSTTSKEKRDLIQRKRVESDHKRRARKQNSELPIRTRLARFIADGWYEPGALYVLREAIGSLRLKRRFVYITDGGHWDNLGLVELVRKRCGLILCFDASLDPKDHFEPLRIAIGLCRSDLGVEIEIDPRPLTRVDGVADEDTITGRILYHDGQVGTLVYSRATVSQHTPAPLVLHAKDHTFPDHSTGDQFFTDEEFEAFRALGFSCADHALDKVDLDGYRPRDRRPAASGRR